MKRFLFSILLCCSFTPLFSQSRMTIDNAINDFATDITSRFANNKIAVIAFETDNNALMVSFIDTMVEKLVIRGAEVYERQYIENVLKELDFSLSGYVSDETAQYIGHFVGADTVIYGALREGNTANEYRMTITATVTETGRILSQKNYNVQIGHEARLWTIGVSAGSSLSRPLAIGTIHGTIAPFRYSFLELGVDVGFLSRKSDEDYWSVCPFAHYAFFWPFDKGGLYAGAGVGYVFGEISYLDTNEKDPVRIITADAIVGVNILDMIDISYTLRTTFSAITNKFSLGYTYRFK